jgi:hypothetical protein
VGLSDLYPRWYGSRELLLHGRDPYSADITREIQQWQRGRPARTGEDEGRFAYPVYVSFVLAPTLPFRFTGVNKVMFWFLLLCAAASVQAWMRFVGWRPSGAVTAIVLACSLSSFAVVFGARLRQPGILVGLLLAAGLVSLAANRLLAAGVLLAFATLKPQLTVLVVPWLLLWSLGRWQHRKMFFWSFMGTLACLVISSEILVHGWIRKFIAAASAYRGYTDGRSVLEVLLSRPGGVIATLITVGALLVLCWKFRRAEADEFAFCSAVVLAVTLVVIPTIAPHGQILLLPGIFLLLRKHQAIWQGGRRCRLAFVATCALGAWTSVFALGFSLLAATSGTAFARRFWLVPVSATPLVPIAVVLTLIIGMRQILPASEVRSDSIHAELTAK